MNKILKKLLLTIILILAVNLLPYLLEENIKASPPPIKVPRHVFKGDIDNLIDSIANEETGNIKVYPHAWDTVNYLHMYGRFQFSKTALIDIGVDTTKSSLNYFLKHPKFQKVCMKNLIQRNLVILNMYVNYKPYLGTQINGVTITLSGLLAACHLGGGGAVKAFLYSDGKNNASDGHDNIGDYISKFGNYYVHI